MTSKSTSHPTFSPKLAASLAGTLAVLVGSVVLLGWALDIGALKSVLPGWVSVKPNTALAFVLIGLATLLNRPSSLPNSQPSTAVSRVGRLCGALAGLIGLLTLGEYAFGWNPGFDQWLFPEPEGTVGTSNPGRMAPETAVCFALLAMAVWIINGSRQPRRVSLAPAIIGLLVTTLALAAMLSYFTPTLGAFGWWGLTIMAVPTAATFAVLGVAVFSLSWQRSALPWSLGKNASLAFAGGVALLIVISLNTSRSVVRLNETNQSVTHTEQVLHAVTAIHAAVAQAQNHTRGYVITGDQRMLESQRAAAAGSSKELGELRQLIADNPRLQQQFTRLETQVKETLQWFQSVIAASRAGVTDATRRQMVSQGQDLMDNLRATVQQIEDEERRLFQQSEEEAAGVARHAYLIISSGTFTSLVIFLAVLFGLNRAVAKRDLAEAALRETNEYLENLFNYANAPIIVWDPQFRITRFNHALESLTGRKADEVIGKPLEILFPPSLVDSSVTLIGKTVTGEHWETVEIGILHVDGSIRTVLWNSATLFTADGKTPVATIAQGQDITVRKQAQEALRQGEEFNRRIVESSNDCIKVLDLDANLLSMSSGGQRLLGIADIVPYLNHCWIDFWQEADRPRVREAVAAARAGGTGRFQAFCAAVTGEPRWWDVIVTPICGASGQPAQLLAVSRDVTERKRTEEARARLLHILESSLNELYVFDAESLRFEYVNQGALCNLGYTMENLRTMTPLDLKPEFTEASFRQAIGPLLRHEEPQLLFQTVHRRADGSLYPVEVHLQLVELPGQRVFLAVILDITERKRTEQALSASEERFRRAVLDSPFPILLHAEDGRILQVSNSWCEITGYTRAELTTIGDWTERAYGERKALVQADIDRLYGLAQRVSEGDYPIRTKAGDTRIWEFSSAPLGRLPDGRRLVVSMAMDVTERRAAENAVRRLNADLEQRVRERTAELEAANRELEAFSYSVSHDLRAPLRAVDGFSMALLEEHVDQLGETARHYLHRIRAGSQQMAELIDDLLGWARLQREPMHRERVDLTAMAAKIGAELQRTHPQRAVELIVAPALAADADPAMVRVVFNNLLGNAWKFTEGRAAARVEVGAVEQHGERGFFVRDNGAGFDMAYADKLFGAFQRLHSASEFEGNGIGLALVQRVVHRHGGRVWAEGAVGQGATVYFTLQPKGSKETP